MRLAWQAIQRVIVETALKKQHPKGERKVRMQALIQDLAAQEQWMRAKPCQQLFGIALDQARNALRVKLRHESGCVQGLRNKFIGIVATLVSILTTLRLSRVFNK